MCVANRSVLNSSFCPNLSSSRVFCSQGNNFRARELRKRPLKSKSRMRCKKMLIYANELKPEGQMKLSGDIDDEEKVGADEAPRRISLGAGKELDKIICLDDVVIIRKGGEKREQATGSHALYEVADRRITLTGKPEKMPTMEQEGTVMEAEKFILSLNSEKVDAIGGKLKEAKLPPMKSK